MLQAQTDCNRSCSRPVKFSFRAQASHNLRHRFPDATPEQLADAPEGCAICKDGMQVNAVYVAE